MMTELLFLSHRIPYPPNKGDKIRSWHFLQHLASRYKVHLGCFVDDPIDMQYREKVASICADTCFVPLNPRRAKLKSLLGLARGRALSLDYFFDRPMANWVKSILTRSAVERIFVFSSPMAQYVPGERAERRRLVVDFVDVDSDKWRQYAKVKSWPMNMIYAREARRLLEFERRTASNSDASVLVSDAEAALFRSLAPECAATIHGIRNGVDFEFFDPSQSFARPFDASEEPLVFTGAMDYWANIEGVGWFARDILPVIRQSRPAARFWIVGANPTPDVVALGSDPAVRVVGRVPDVRPYLAHAAIVVAPLRIARGLQNKVLEAMAMAKFVIATPQAIEGISARADEVDVAETAESFASSCVKSLADPDRGKKGTAARRRMTQDFEWTRSLDALTTLIDGGRPRSSARTERGRVAEGVGHES